MSDTHTLEHIKATLKEHQYIYLQAIGKGGFSTVHLVHSQKYNEEFVVKVSEGVKSAASEAEIQTLMGLIHPNIISIYEFFFDNEQSLCYMILEYCPGGSLGDLIKKNGAIPPPLLYLYCNQAISALHYCHSLNVAHRDIKPANLLLDRNNRIKLADFGLSSRYEEGCSPSEVSFSGSRPYMSPEMIKRQKYCPFKSDVWALGVTFFQLSAGRLPWGTTNEIDMKLAISMGVVSFQHCKGSSEFFHCLKSMMIINEAKRVNIDWVAQQEVFRSASERRQKKKMMKPSHSFGSNLDLMKLKGTPKSSNLFSDTQSENESYSPTSRTKLAVGGRRKKSIMTMSMLSLKTGKGFLNLPRNMSIDTFNLAGGSNSGEE